jgi:hypothetical protein
VLPTRGSRRLDAAARCSGLASTTAAPRRAFNSITQHGNAMVICIDGHCFDVVVIDIWPPHTPGPGPVNYPQMIYDATLVASVRAATEKAQDE